jgi:hypothetical protein
MQIAEFRCMPVYICYVSKSGTVINIDNISHFVLAGMAIPAVQWKELDEKISRIKRKFELDEAEIDSASMMRRYAEQESLPGFSGQDYQSRRQEVRRTRDGVIRHAVATRTQTSLPEIIKNHKNKDRDNHLTQVERTDFLKKICDEVKTWTDARLFAEAYDKNVLTAFRANPPRLYEVAFTRVMSRFQAFLVNRGNYLGTPLYGLIVKGSNGAVAAIISKVVRDYHEKGMLRTKFDKIVETPLFIDTRLASMVQIADVCAYAVQQFFETGESDLLDRIYTKFDRAKDTVVGIRHYSAQKHCHCRVCVDHNVPPPKKWSRGPDVLAV